MKNENSQETVDLVGVKDGVETPLGKIPMPPEMKLKEIMRTYFGGDANDPESDACLGVAAGMEFFNWLIGQGYKPPGISLNAGGSGHQITDERIIEIRQKTPAQPGLWGQTIPFARALLAERDSIKG